VPACRFGDADDESVSGHSTMHFERTTASLLAGDIAATDAARSLSLLRLLRG
jgi:hypothetical protein